MAEEVISPPVAGMEPDELAEWFESLDDVARRDGAGQVRELLAALRARAGVRQISPSSRAWIRAGGEVASTAEKGSMIS